MKKVALLVLLLSASLWADRFECGEGTVESYRCSERDSTHAFFQNNNLWSVFWKNTNQVHLYYNKKYKFYEDTIDSLRADSVIVMIDSVSYKIKSVSYELFREEEEMKHLWLFTTDGIKIDKASRIEITVYNKRYPLLWVYCDGMIRFVLTVFD